MKKAVKKAASKKEPAQAKKIVEGSRVIVVTEYVVKRFDKKLPNLVAVDDQYGDRVLNFRLEELKLVE